MRARASRPRNEPPPRRPPARPRCPARSGRADSPPYHRAMTGEELREVMRRFPAPVAVVTAEHDGERFGLTVGSLVSLSLAPPLVGISIGKDSSSHEPIRRAEGWAASLLAADQGDVARHFARSGIP